MPINSEWDLLDRITKQIRSGLPEHLPDLLTGIGDDCAVYRLGPDRFGLFSTDMSVESVHFITGKSSPEDIGYKAMTGNISDVSAMGGACRLALVALGVPPGTEEDYIASLYKGMTEAASMAGLAIAGGDISSSKELVISISIYGETAGYDPVLRSGARPNDTIYITGSLGECRAGLDLLMNDDPAGMTAYRGLTEKHDRPPCRASIVEPLMKLFKPTAMIDISDGLLSDLGHIVKESGRGFLLKEELFPCTPLLRSYCAEKGLEPENIFLNSGEEYELLFTSAARPGEAAGEINGVAVTPIGTILDKEYFIEKQGAKIPVTLSGFDHFKK
ncbi:MAG: thiamine-phosphate kinase [Spirochaetae bacterium HGW-Spirochaetae-1]|jgi:thiamine-monophosphate kinase|nr:MAG: thiamine-phosphate kinase [Spirochaetae bacterium HGW-Spirochaetae-1]